MTKTAVLLPYPARSENITELAKQYRSLDIIRIEQAYSDTIVQEGCSAIIGGDIACRRAEELSVSARSIPAGIE